MSNPYQSVQEWNSRQEPATVTHARHYFKRLTNQTTKLAKAIEDETQFGTDFTAQQLHEETNAYNSLLSDQKTHDNSLRNYVGSGPTVIAAAYERLNRETQRLANARQNANYFSERRAAVQTALRVTQEANSTYANGLDQSGISHPNPAFTGQLSVVSEATDALKPYKQDIKRIRHHLPHTHGFRREIDNFEQEYKQVAQNAVQYFEWYPAENQSGHGNQGAQASSDLASQLQAVSLDNDVQASGSTGHSNSQSGTYGSYPTDQGTRPQEQYSGGRTTWCPEFGYQYRAGTVPPSAGSGPYTSYDNTQYLTQYIGDDGDALWSQGSELYQE